MGGGKVVAGALVESTKKIVAVDALIALDLPSGKLCGAFRCEFSDQGNHAVGINGLDPAEDIEQPFLFYVGGDVAEGVHARGGCVEEGRCVGAGEHSRNQWNMKVK